MISSNGASRRQFLAGLSCLGVPAERLIGDQQNPVIRLAPGPEVEAFKRAQTHVLEKFHVRAQSKFVSLRNPALRAHILVTGHGDPVVMVHGGGAVAVLFAPLFAALAGEFRVFAPDRPGCGLTDKFNYSGVSFRSHAVDFLTSALNALRLPRASIVGNSMGGYWALVFALAVPERVTRLVLLGGPAGSPQPPYPKLPPRPEPSLENTRQMYRVLMANGDRVAPEILEADYAASRLPGAALGWNSMLEELGLEDADHTGLTYALRPELKNLRPPTLFIWGDKDIEGRPSLGQEMAAIAPHAQCEVVPEAGHLPWLDQPDRCATLVANFLRSV